MKSAPAEFQIVAITWIQLNNHPLVRESSELLHANLTFRLCHI